MEPVVTMSRFHIDYVIVYELYKYITDIFVAVEFRTKKKE